MRYDVKCPTCGSRASALMVGRGVRGTYRELLERMVAKSMSCLSCGSAWSEDGPAGLEIELWFKYSVDGHLVWANNETHLELLINWLSGALDRHELDPGDRAVVEALPKWRISGGTRIRVVRRLRAFLRTLNTGA